VPTTKQIMNKGDDDMCDSKGLNPVQTGMKMKPLPFLAELQLRGKSRGKSRTPDCFKMGSRKSSLAGESPRYGSVAPDYSRDSSLAPDYSRNSSVAPEYSRNSSVAPNCSRNGSVAPDFSRNGSVAPDYSRNDSVAPDYSRNGSVAPDNSRNSSVVQDNYRNVPVAPNYSINGCVVQDISRDRSVVHDYSRNCSVIQDISRNGSEVHDYSRNNSVMEDISRNGSVVPDYSGNKSAEISRNSPELQDYSRNSLVAPDYSKDVSVGSDLSVEFSKNSSFEPESSNNNYSGDVSVVHDYSRHSSLKSEYSKHSPATQTRNNSMLSEQSSINSMASEHFKNKTISEHESRPSLETTSVSIQEAHDNSVTISRITTSNHSKNCSSISPKVEPHVDILADASLNHLEILPNQEKVELESNFLESSHNDTNVPKIHITSNNSTESSNNQLKETSPEFNSSQQTNLPEKLSENIAPSFKEQQPSVITSSPTSKVTTTTVSTKISSNSVEFVTHQKPDDKTTKVQPRVPSSPTILRRKGLKESSPNPKSVSFKLPDPREEEEGEVDVLDPPVSTDTMESSSGIETAAGSAESARPPKSKKSGRSGPLKITERSNMTNLANAIIPQLTDMQKNFLGLLFFNELSQKIVDEMVAQQLSMMPGTKIIDLLSVIDPQAKESASRVLLEQADPADRATLVVESLSTMDTVEVAETVLNISGYQSVDVVKYMCEMGGRKFKMAVIESLLQSENLKLVPKKSSQDDPQMGSDGCDEVFDSCEEGTDANQSKPSYC